MLVRLEREREELSGRETTRSDVRDSGVGGRSLREERFRLKRGRRNRCRETDGA